MRRVVAVPSSCLPSYDNPDTPPITNHATMLKDGTVVTTVNQLAEWSARATLQSTAGYIHQLPRSLEFRVDAEKFLDAFSYVDASTGSRVNVGPWRLGPGYHAEDDVGESDAGSSVGEYLPDTAASLRRAKLNKWNLFKRKCMKFIPACSNRTLPDIADAVAGPSGMFALPLLIRLSLTAVLQRILQKGRECRANQGMTFRKIIQTCSCPAIQVQTSKRLASKKDPARRSMQAPTVRLTWNVSQTSNVETQAIQSYRAWCRMVCVSILMSPVSG